MDWAAVLRDVSIVIVNFNALAHVRRCLASLDAGAAGLSWEAIVVDNASRERGAAQLAHDFANVRVIERSVNGGFAVGANTGIRVARGAAVLILNPDTEVRPRAIRVLWDYLAAHPDVGIVGPRIVNPDGSLQLSCRGFPSLWTGLFNRTALLTRLFPHNRHASAYLMTDWTHDATRAVDWLSGAVLMLSAGALAQIGLFDERYFFACEDVDLCKRAHDAGLGVVYHPAAEVVHQVGVSAATARNRVIIAHHRGMWHYYRRHLRRQGWLDPVVAGGIITRCLARLTQANLARWRGVGTRPSPATLVRP